MLEQVRETLEQTAEQTLADCGYETAEGLAKAEQLGAEVIVAPNVDPQKVGDYHLARFTYDEQAQTVHCPIGQELRRVGPATHRDKPQPLTRYRCDVWKSCPVGTLCSKSKPRVVEIGAHYGAVLRQRQKLADPDNRKSLKRRSEIIERLFGQIKGNDGFSRWTFRGKQKVAAQWTMICTAINLRKLIARLPFERLAPA
jgi:hypothetical protein